MSQRDLWSRGAAALLRECYPAAGGVLCPPLGLCGQTPSCTSTKLSNMGATLSATLDVCRPLIKIHYNFLQSLVQEAVRQPHIDHIHMTPPKSSLESSHSTPFNCWTSERSSDETDGKCQNLLLMKDAYRCAVLGIQRDRRRGRESEAAVRMVVCSPVRAML